ncbi:MAG: glycosyltransferase [Planctomycetaceae bacterium]|nr:MAG: glycosyltransferase [Planctomycetaceae bacterium]
MTAKPTQLRIALISLHGLIRGHEPELGRDADTGGQVKYVLELARELGRREQVERVDLITRQIVDPRVGPEYAQVEESIGPKARIIRLPFGPRRYLRKEALWPYLELFVDQCLMHFRRYGIPHVLHGHYADAGYAGAQLARLLQIPYVFTGHSLGRVKRERLMVAKESDPQTLEHTYQFSARNEAEEISLETASLVITSTSQEVKDQYEKYEHYQPDRMEVIPPGVELGAFRPPDADGPAPPIAERLEPFLRDPSKPIILAVARPDSRKNFETLVEVYGGSKKLRELANLVLVMGQRDDLRELSAGGRRVLLNVLTLIDVHDLYGQVAYPKSHQSGDISELYRWAAKLRGVFINPALTEPFGLTLLESGASGLPVIATADGGPVDIIGNCQNGLLVDPLDHSAMEHALLRMLTEPESWDTWAHNGVEGVTRHYSWQHHVDRYLRDVGEIVEESAASPWEDRRQPRRLPDFDRLIICDLDNTLEGDDQALQEFIEMLQDAGRNVGFGIATGRRLDDVMEWLERRNMPRPDVLATAVGTELYYGKDLRPDFGWKRQISAYWRPDEIRKVLDPLPGFTRQEDHEQTEFKVSYQIDPELAPPVQRIRRLLREAGLRVKVIFSLGMFLDIVPIRAGSDLSIRYLAYRWGFEPEQLLIAGDSGNDEGMLKGRTLGVVVGNYSPELEKLRKSPRVYFAEGHHARGILEGIEYYNFLGNVRIPNDSAE